MTPQERQLIDDLFDRLSKMENAPRDADAMAAIAQGLRLAPNAIYPLVQTVLVQDEALRRANDRIQELESQGAHPQNQGGGFLDSMRGAIFGQGQSQGQGQGSVPNVPPPGANRPVWNSGQVLQQTSQGRYDESGYGQHDQGGYGQGGYGQSYGGPQAPMGGGMMGGGTGGSFLGTAAAAAAGVVGGSLLLNSIRSMMGGHHYGLSDAGATGDRSSGQGPWTDQSGSSLARDAGVNDISASHDRGGDDSRAGLLDTASQDERDDMDMDSDDFGNDGDSDFA